MVSEVIRKKVYDAATQGDVTKFQEVVEEDPYILDVVSFAGSRTVLHIATLWGKAGIVEEVLKINPRLARSLDSEKKSALHLAAEEGAVGIASKLVSIAPAMCWLRDCHGMNPIHIAAMNGHAEVLKELIREDPLPAREKVDRGQTALHLCVKHGQLRAFKVLENRLGELVFLKDDDGETLLHLAVRYKQVEIARYLTEKYTIQAPSVNSKGETAMQISRESRRVDATYYSEIRKVLIQQAKVYADIGFFRTINHVVIAMHIMIDGNLQSILSPPGGVWQDDSSTHKAGKAIMASNHPELYEYFIILNTEALTSSTVTILLIMLETNSSIYLYCTILLGSSLSVSKFYMSYVVSIEAITPSHDTEPFQNLDSIVWMAAIATCLVLVGNHSFFQYFAPRIALLFYSLLVACEGMVVIRNYCGEFVDALLKLPSLIDKYVWRLDRDSTP